jgi:transposase-like protein
MTNLTLPIFTDPEAARKHFEALLWPNGPICPRCGTLGEATLMKGKTTRPGLYQCNACYEPFSVTVGTVMERSHIPLNKWALGFHLMAASKKGISAHQLMRMLGLGSYRSAWFMAHRIREAMAPAEGSEPPLGGSGKIVEGDDTELAPSHKTRAPGRAQRSKNQKFMTLVERGGRAKSIVLNEKNAKIIGIATMGVIDRTSTLHSDGGKGYRSVVPADQHEVVIHKDEYARDGETGRVHTNTAEGFFSIFKRGLVGTYQHMDARHLHRYLAEFDFRMSNRAKLGVNDTMRAELAIKGAEGKRLMYRATVKQPEA